MVSILLIVAASFTTAAAPALAAEEPAPTAEVLQRYDQEKARAGQDAESQVQLALWCEANGLRAERARHLAQAVLRDPSNVRARGLLGLVEFQGRWRRPEQVVAALTADDKSARAAAIAQYLQKRAQTPEKGEDQYKLGLWCEENGLKDQAKAHYQRATQLEPTREAAWKRLGFKKQNGQWVSEERSAAAKHDADLQRQADHHWRPLLEAARAGLASTHGDRRESAETTLSTISDPRAAASVWSIFGASKDPASQAKGVQILGQIDAAMASRGLAMLAVSASSAETRRAAAETLTRRDVREFADLLIALIREPIKYEVDAVANQGQSGSLSVHGKKANVRRIYTPPPVPLPAILPNDQLGVDANGLPAIYRPYQYSVVNGLPNRQISLTAPTAAETFTNFFASHLGEAGRIGAQNAVQNGLLGPYANIHTDIDGLPANLRGQTLMPIPAGATVLNRSPSTDLVNISGYVQIPIGQLMAQAEYANAAARQTMENDINQIETYNKSVTSFNDRVLPVLAGVAGANFGTDLTAWRNWWIDQVGMAILPQRTQDTPTVVEQVPIDFQFQATQPVIVSQTSQTQRLMSCFAAGTLVQTQTGLRPIESLKVGDVVLTQSVKTAGLGYQPVVKVHHNPPSATFKIVLGGETIVSSAFHRFWAPGRGWVMARDLKPGDVLRTLGGLATVSTVENDRVQPVFNLDIAEDADFFVGHLGALAHDNTLPDTRLTPFDLASTPLDSQGKAGR